MRTYLKIIPTMFCFLMPEEIIHLDLLQLKKFGNFSVTCTNKAYFDHKIEGKEFAVRAKLLLLRFFICKAREGTYHLL
jgi:hypothetical protein